MDLKYIIHPQTNKKIDLFSNDGLTILNQYITIFKFGGDGNFKLGYRTSRRHDKLYKIDKTLGRFHNITEKRKGKKGKGKRIDMEFESAYYQFKLNIRDTQGKDGYPTRMMCDFKSVK